MYVFCVIRYEKKSAVETALFFGRRSGVIRSTTPLGRMDKAERGTGICRHTPILALNLFLVKPATARAYGEQSGGSAVESRATSPPPGREGGTKGGRATKRSRADKPTQRDKTGTPKKGAGGETPHRIGRRTPPIRAPRPQRAKQKAPAKGTRRAGRSAHRRARARGDQNEAPRGAAGGRQRRAKRCPPPSRSATLSGGAAGRGWREPATAGGGFSRPKAPGAPRRGRGERASKGEPKAARRA